jgi:hypothetical protein
MSNSSYNTDDESDSEPHNASLSTISLQNVSLPWPNYSKYIIFFFVKYSKDFFKVFEILYN